MKKQSVEIALDAGEWVAADKRAASLGLTTTKYIEGLLIRNMQERAAAGQIPVMLTVEEIGYILSSFAGEIADLGLPVGRDHDAPGKIAREWRDIRRSYVSKSVRRQKGLSHPCSRSDFVRWRDEFDCKAALIRRLNPLFEAASSPEA